MVGSYDDKIWALNADGTNVTGWPVQTGGDIDSSPALGDIDGDGDLEVVVGSYDDKIWALNADGTNVTGWPVQTGGDIDSSPALGDIDGDGDLEVVVGSYDDKIWALNADGTNVTGWPVQTGSGVFSSPALGDLDGDGRVEIVIGSDDGYIYALNEKGVYEEHLYPWPKFHHDNNNTGLYKPLSPPSEPSPTESQPVFIMSQGDADTLLLSTVGLGIIIGIGVAFIITIVLFRRKINTLNNQISVINKKIGSTSASKK